MKIIFIFIAAFLVACQSNNAQVTNGKKKIGRIPVADCQKIPSGLSRDDLIIQCFQLNSNNLNAIYEHALRQDPDIEGSLYLKITTGKSGEVVTLEVVESTMPAGKLRDNLQAYVGLMKFGKGLANQDFPHKLNFYNN